MEIDNEIIRLYIQEKMSVPKICKKFDVCTTTIYNILKKHNISRRSPHECQFKFEIDKDILYELYYDKELSIKKISEQLNISEECIRRKMHEYKLKRRNKTHNFSGWNKGLTKENNEVVKNIASKCSETRKKLFKNGELKHWHSGKPTDLNTRKKISETLLNGREPAPSRYGNDWRMQRTECLHRDNYTCQCCGSVNDIQVHHWEPYRFSFDNSLDNLVVLCKSCHKDKHKEYKKEGFIKEMEDAFYGDV